MQPKQDLVTKVMQYKRWLIIGGAVLILFFIVSLFFQGGPNVQERAMNFQDRIQKLQAFITTNRKMVSTTPLSNQTANIAVMITGATSSIQQLNQTTYGGSAKATEEARKQNAALAAQYAARIQTAFEANTFEIRYQQIIIEEMKELVAIAGRLSRSENKAVATTFLAIYNNFRTAQTDLEKITL